MKHKIVIEIPPYYIDTLGPGAGGGELGGLSEYFQWANTPKCFLKSIRKFDQDNNLIFCTCVTSGAPDFSELLNKLDELDRNTEELSSGNNKHSTYLLHIVHIGRRASGL
jgi:hypothetical protein